MHCIVETLLHETSQTKDEYFLLCFGQVKLNDFIVSYGDKSVMPIQTSHHQFNGYELGQTPGDAEWDREAWAYIHGGHKESDMTWSRNNGPGQ